MKKNWSREPLNSLDKECMVYFRQPVFDRILRGFREKYISYGSFSGTVVLQRLSGEEIEILEGFFQKSFHGQKSVSVSASRFEKALKDSRFGGISPKNLLELYFQEEMTGKKEQRDREARRWQQLLEEVQDLYPGTPAQKLLDELGKTRKKAEELPEASVGYQKETPEEKYQDEVFVNVNQQEKLTGEQVNKDSKKLLEQNKNIFMLRQYLAKLYRESGKQMDEVQKVLKLAAGIVNALPYRSGSLEYLAVFAALMTGNPHAFDDGMKDGQLLYLLLKWDTENRKLEVKKSEVFPALQKQRLYFASGILRDDVSNYAMVSGLLAWKKDGTPHEGMKGFCQEGDAVQVPLGVIAEWDRVACPEQTIYIVENPSIYAMLCRKWQGERAFMCMNGQPRLSSLLVLDLLAAAGICVYYAGDFDPEGLLIAQKLKLYYQGKLCFWHMSKQVYQKSRSAEQIPQKRLRMLERIQSPELKETADAVRESKMAGYQENVWEIYLEDEKMLENTDEGTRVWR